MSQPRLDLLREALPYIQRFKGKTFVVKFSGKVTEDKENLASLAEELALLNQVGIRLCVIHGGGKQLSELADKLGVAQTVIEGRRVQVLHGEAQGGRAFRRIGDGERWRGTTARRCAGP